MFPHRTCHRRARRGAIPVLTALIDQISGINIITYYAATIFEQDIGLSSFLSRLLAALNGTEYFIASWVAVFAIERFGRRNLMMFGSAGQAVGHSRLRTWQKTVRS